MVKNNISSGTAHKLPGDLKQALASSEKALITWEDITPLARNEWICWTISVKNPETRKQHIKRGIDELTKGKRRPCCWIGCVHRTDKSISSSVQYVLNKQRRLDKKDKL